MTPRRLAIAAVALAAVIGGIIAAIAALTSEPAGPDRAAEVAPARPAPAAPATAASPEVAPPAVAVARTPPPVTSTGKPVVRSVTPRSGPSAGGGQAVIQGTNLGGVAQVMFGTTPARIAARAEDALTVDVPSGAPGAATLVLTNADGSYGVAPAAYTYR